MFISKLRGKNKTLDWGHCNLYTLILLSSLLFDVDKDTANRNRINASPYIMCAENNIFSQRLPKDIVRAEPKNEN